MHDERIVVDSTDGSADLHWRIARSLLPSQMAFIICIDCHTCRTRCHGNEAGPCRVGTYIGPALLWLVLWHIHCFCARLVGLCSGNCEFLVTRVFQVSLKLSLSSTEVLFLLCLLLTTGILCYDYWLGCLPRHLEDPHGASAVGKCHLRHDLICWTVYILIIIICLNVVKEPKFCYIHTFSNTPWNILLRLSVPQSPWCWPVVFLCFRELVWMRSWRQRWRRYESWKMLLPPPDTVQRTWRNA